MKECLEPVVAYPYWEDVLGRSRGDLAELRLLFQDVEELEDGALDDNPEIEDHRPLLRAQLGLATPRDPAKLLHHAVTLLSEGLLVRAPDGHLSEPLAGASRRF